VIKYLTLYPLLPAAFRFIRSSHLNEPVSEKFIYTPLEIPGSRRITRSGQQFPACPGIIPACFKNVYFKRCEIELGVLGLLGLDLFTGSRCKCVFSPEQINYLGANKLPGTISQILALYPLLIKNFNEKFLEVQEPFFKKVPACVILF
jgi:hypothetical protein